MCLHALASHVCFSCSAQPTAFCCALLLNWRVGLHSERTSACVPTSGTVLCCHALNGIWCLIQCFMHACMKSEAQGGWRAIVWYLFCNKRKQCWGHTVPIISSVVAPAKLHRLGTGHACARHMATRRKSPTQSRVALMPELPQHQDGVTQLTGSKRRRA